MTQEGSPQKSDLGVRTLSAMVMVAIAGSVFWAGGWIFNAFVLLIAIGLIWEWQRLARRAFRSNMSRAAALSLGFAYIAVACLFLLMTNWQDMEMQNARFDDAGLDFFSTARAQILLPLIAAVIATDVGAYFAGRSVGGPKILPAVSPSKTWSGLIGGMLLAGMVYAGAMWFFDSEWSDGFFCVLILFGALAALVAQSGDFLESYVKRRAGVKDSSNLIPGHGGLLDRMDGMLAVFFIFGLISFAGFWF